MDTSTGKYLDANKSAENLTGRTLNELKRMKTDDITPKGAKERLEKLSDASGLIEFGEIEYIRPDGTSRIALLVSIPISKNQVFGIAHDITERKHTEEVMTSSLSLLNATLESTADGILVVNRNGKITRYNRIFAEMWQISEELISNDDDFSIISHIISQLSKPEQFIDRVKYLYANPGESSFDQIEFLDGRIFERYSQPQKIGGEVVGRVWSFRDITERKRAEEDLKESHKRLEETLAKLKETQRQVLHQERMRSLGQLASGIAHDINNSLTPILGYVDLLTDDEELMKRNEKSIQMIIKSTKNIARTIGRLKEFYKVKLTDEDLVEINMNKVVNSAIELTKHKWKNMAESTGSVIEIKGDFADPLPLTKVDESELIEAITNVVLNACDAMPNGGTLTFKTYQKDNNIIIQIKDTGIGMDEETLKHCMDPFFTTKGEKGTGLGLAMTYGVIERHKGEMKIESEPNKGTSISLVLPINKELNVDKKIVDYINLIRPLKILSVEDDILISDMLKNILESRGHKLIQAQNGLSGLEQYKKSIDEKVPFDLVITDLGMPGLNGSTLSKEIKKNTPNIPIILLTGWGSLINKDDYPTIDYLLKKPIMMKDLFHALNLLFK